MKKVFVSKAPLILGVIKPRDLDETSKKQMLFGIQNEEKIRNIASEYIKMSIKKPNKTFYHPNYNWLGCKPDGLCDDGIPFEAKTCCSNKNLLTIPLENYIQLQLTMFILQKHFIIYSRNFQETTLTQTVYFDKEFVKEIIPLLYNYVFNKSMYITRHTNIELPKYNYNYFWKLFPLFDDDILSYYFTMKDKPKDNHTLTEKLELEKNNQLTYKLYNTILNLYECINIPISYNHYKCLNNMTKNCIERNVDIIYNPVCIYKNYYYQPSIFLIKSYILNERFSMNIDDDDKYIPTFVVNTLNEHDKIKMNKCEFICKSLNLGQKYVVISMNNNNEFVGETYEIDYNLITLDNILHKNYDELLRGDITRKKIIKYNLIPKSCNKFRYKSLHNEFIKSTNHCIKLYNIGYKKVSELYKRDIISLEDLDINVLNPLQQNIIYVNKTNKNIYPSSIEENDLINTINNEGYIDIEASSLFIVNIGLYHGNKFYSFVIDNLNNNSEENMLDNFSRLIRELGIQRLYHWGHYDSSRLTKANKKYGNKWYFSEFVDFFSIMKKNNIAVGGSYNLKLKTVANALYSKNLIKTFHSEEHLLDGRDLLSYLDYKYDTNSYNKTDKYVKDIVKYNEYDVITMYEIIQYIRNYYKK